MQGNWINNWKVKLEFSKKIDEEIMRLNCQPILRNLRKNKNTTRI